MEPHGQARGTSMFSAESAEAYPPAHKASEGYPFRIHPRLKPCLHTEVRYSTQAWSSAKADKIGNFSILDTQISKSSPGSPMKKFPQTF